MNPIVGIVLLGIMLLISAIVFIFLCVLLRNVTTTPDCSDDGFGYSGRYLNYATTNPDISGETLLVQLSIATANFGGIYTYQKDKLLPSLSPWNGKVSAEAAILQVKSGARAIVFDIWPDPTNRMNPIIAAMKDMTDDIAFTWWREKGLENSNGYSSWINTACNKGPAADIIGKAVDTAFSTGIEDPFFLILNVHGYNDDNYLNNLGTLLSTRIEDNRIYNQKGFQSDNINTITLNKLKGKVFVIVNPDDDPENIKRTRLYKDLTNYLVEKQKFIYRNKEPVVKKSFACIQPSIGVPDVSNIIKNDDFMLSTFVALNVFSLDDSRTLWLDRYAKHGIRKF